MPSNILNVSAPAVLVLTGLGGASLEPRFFVRRLRDHGFHAVIHSIAAPGRANATTLRDDRTAFQDWIAAGVETIDSLASSHAEVHLCGISLGATLALALASERPLAIASLTIISTLLYSEGWNVPRWRQLMPLLYRTPLWRLYRPRERYPYGAKNERVRAWIVEQLELTRMPSQGVPGRTSTTLLREADRLTRHVRSSLDRVRSPTLMIHAREDDVASLANIRYIQTHLRTSEFFTIIVDNSYHLLCFDNERESVASKAIQFMNTRSRSGADASVD